VTSFALELLVYPALYAAWRGRLTANAAARDEPHPSERAS
jgi:hypothetical protein